MDRLKKVRFKYVFTIICLITLGYILGVISTINIVNDRLAYYDISINFKLFQNLIDIK